VSPTNCPYKNEAWTDSSRTTSPLFVVVVHNNEVSKGHSYMDTSIKGLRKRVADAAPKPGRLGLDDPDALDLIGAYEVKRPRLSLFRFVGVTLAEESSVQPSAPDVAVAKVADLGQRFGDPHGERAGHLPPPSFASRPMTIDALSPANSKHIVMPFPPSRKDLS